MEDFRASAPEQRGPANPNVESVPFEEMKERILKIVNGYNGLIDLLLIIPLTRKEPQYWGKGKINSYFC